MLLIYCISVFRYILMYVNEMENMLQIQ